MEQAMRTAKNLSIAVGVLALTFVASAPRASAMTIAAPATIDTVAPNNGMVEKVRTVCQRYRYWRHGRWHWRTRCYTTPSRRYYYRPYAPPPPPRYYPSPYPYYYR
jgi:hypothetical protein